MQPPHARNVRTGQRGGPNFVRAAARALRELSDVAGTAANSVSTRLLAYAVKMRTMTCSTNAIESLNARFRRAARARGRFPTKQAAVWGARGARIVGSSMPKRLSRA